MHLPSQNGSSAKEEVHLGSEDSSRRSSLPRELLEFMSREHASAISTLEENPFLVHLFASYTAKTSLSRCDTPSEDISDTVTVQSHRSLVEEYEELRAVHKRAMTKVEAKHAMLEAEIIRLKKAYDESQSKLEKALSANVTTCVDLAKAKNDLERVNGELRVLREKKEEMKVSHEALVETLKRETARAQHEMQNLRDEVKSMKSADGIARPLVGLGEDGVNDLAECLLRAFSGPKTRIMK